MPAKDETYIKVRCTAAQKRRIEDGAKAAGARSLNQYCLTVLLEGKTEEYGSLRRRAEGVIANAQTYHQLIQLNQALQERGDLDVPIVQEAIALVQEVAREMVLARLANRVEEMQG